MIKLPIELFEIKNELSPTIVKELYNWTTNNYNLLHLSNLAYTIPEAIFHCTESISFLDIKIKSTVLDEFEELSSLSLLRKAVKNVSLKIVLPGYARHAPRILGFSIIYYLFGFVFTIHWFYWLFLLGYMYSYYIMFFFVADDN